MPRPAANRIKVTSTTNGTGTFTLGGAVGGEHAHAFLASLNGLTVDYSSDHNDAAEWEDGRGVYTHSGTTLSRLYVENGSNGSSLVNFSSGTKTVRLSLLASRAVLTIATTDPGVNDDFANGHVPGAEWLNSSGGKLWKCISNPNGAADWEVIHLYPGVVIAQSELRATVSTIVSPTLVSNAVTLDFEAGNDQFILLTANLISIVFNNLPGSGDLIAMSLWFQAGSPGGWTATFPAEFDWGDASPPTMPLASGAEMVIAIMSRNGGASWKAALAWSD